MSQRKRKVAPSHWKSRTGVNFKNHQVTFVRMMAAFGICKSPAPRRLLFKNKVSDPLVLEVPEWLFELANNRDITIDQIRKARKDRTLRAALVAASKLARMPEPSK